MTMQISTWNAVRHHARRDVLSLAGHKLEGNESLADFLMKTGTDFTVEKTPLYAASGPVSGIFGVDRISSNGLRNPLPGVAVGPKMQLFQNSASFAPLATLVEQGLATYEFGGTMKQGAIVFARADLGQTLTVNRLDGTADPVSAKLLARNAHNGSANLIWGLSPLRFFCTNQLNGMLAEKLAFEVRIRHSARGTERVEQLGKQLAILLAEFGKAGVVWQDLADKRMNEAEFTSIARLFLAEIYGTVSTESDEKARAAREKREKDTSDLVAYFKEGKGNTGESAWDAYNGIGEWLEHRQERYATAKWTAAQFQRHAASQAFGEGRNRRSLALRMLTRY